MLGPALIDTQDWEPNWSHKKRVELITIWEGGREDVQVQQKFGQASKANNHIYKATTWWMQKCGC